GEAGVTGQAVGGPGALEKMRTVVVIPYQPGFVGDEDGLRATADIDRRTPHRKKARLDIAAAGDLDQLLVGREKLRHVRFQSADACKIRRARTIAVTQKPPARGVPMLLEPGPPFE